MKNIKLITLLFIIVSAPLSLFSYEPFNKIMEQMRKITLAKMPIYQSQLNGNILDNDVKTCCNTFETIYQKFKQGSFAQEKTVITAFENLCKIINAVDKAIVGTFFAKPWHIRWIRDAIEALVYSTNCIKNFKYEDMYTAQMIKDFYFSTNRKIFPLFSAYVGTPLERIIVDKLRQAGSFVVRNWWWEIPLLIAASKIGYDVYNHAPEKPNPETWNFNETTTKKQDYSWYKKFAGYVAGLFFVSAAVSDGYISTSNGYVNHPIAETLEETQKNDIALIDGTSETQTNNPQLKVISGDGLPKRIVRQIPTIHQSRLECAWFALYFAWCWTEYQKNPSTENKNLFINKAKFNEKIQQWKANYRNYKKANFQQLKNDWVAKKTDNTENKDAQYYDNNINNADDKIRQVDTENIDNWLVSDDVITLAYDIIPEFRNNENILIDDTYEKHRTFLYKNTQDKPDQYTFDDTTLMSYGSREIPRWRNAIARLRYAQQPPLLIVIVRYGNHWKTFLITKEGQEQIPSITITESLGANEVLHEGIVNKLFNMYFAQRMDGIEAFARQLNLIK